VGKGITREGRAWGGGAVEKEKLGGGINKLKKKEARGIRGCGGNGKETKGGGTGDESEG